MKAFIFFGLLAGLIVSMIVFFLNIFGVFNFSEGEMSASLLAVGFFLFAFAGALSGLVNSK